MWSDLAEIKSVAVDEELQKQGVGNQLVSAGCCWDPVNDRLYAYGGSPSGGTPIDLVQRYDPAADTWSLTAPMQSARMWIKGLY